MDAALPCSAAIHLCTNTSQLYCSSEGRLKQQLQSVTESGKNWYSCRKVSVIFRKKGGNSTAFAEDAQLWNDMDKRDYNYAIWVRAYSVKITLLSLTVPVSQVADISNTRASSLALHRSHQ